MDKIDTISDKYNERIDNLDKYRQLRRQNILQLSESTDASSAGLMSQLLKTAANQLEIQRRTNTVLQDLTISMTALAQNQTELHLSMARQEEKIRQIETVTLSLATQVQEIQDHLASAMPLPPSYEESTGEGVQLLLGEVQL